jgi:hypothetical protein
MESFLAFLDKKYAISKKEEGFPALKKPLNLPRF